MPTNIYCPMCEKRGVTETHKKASVAQYISCLAIFSIGCAVGCCLLPFCIESCKDTVHYCANCKVPLGRKTIIK